MLLTVRYITCFLALLLMVAGCSTNTGGAAAPPSPQSTLIRGGAALPAVGTPTPGSEGGTPALPPPTPTTPVTPSPTPPPTATLPPNERIALAQEAERIGEWEMAFSLYESLRSDPVQGTTALFRLGDLYLRDDREVEAALAWQEGLSREPDGPLAPFLKYRLARGLAALGRHESAIELWQQVDAATDGTVDDILADHMADSYLALGQLDQAAAQWQRIYETEAAPRVSRALAARQVAKWHADHQRWAEGLAWYKQTLELSQVHTFRAELLIEMARMSLALGDAGAARSQWQLLLEEYADTPQALAAAQALQDAGEPISAYRMGELYFKNKRWTEAARAFFTSLESEADLPVAHQQAALALEQAGNYAASFKEWRKIVETHPEAIELQDDAWLGMGRAHVELGDMDVAVATLEQTVALYPKGDAAPEALWLLAIARRDQGAADVAAATFERLATTYPEAERSTEALWRAGMLRYRDGKAEAARADFVLLAGRDSEAPTRALFWAGKAARLAGDEQGAYQHWAEAVRSNRADYYALRAAALLNHTTWQPRANQPFSAPATDDSTWLREAAQLPPTTNLLTLPDDPRLQRGKTLLLLGERGAAFETFREVIREHGENPQALWAMAHDFRAANLPSMSIVAATRLMEELGYTVLTVPPTLAALAYPLPYEAQLRSVAAQSGFDPLLFAALIHQESTWEPRARSSASARGLTQVIPDTGRWIAQRLNDPNYSYHHLDRPVVSLRYGSYYLSYVLGLFNDNPFKALAAYNSGPGNARRWESSDDDLFVENIPLRETRYYIERLYEHWHGYQRAYRLHSP